MPVRTPHFGLEAFITGDIYSEVVDTRRFMSIDSHMAFISDLVGPGVIEGWELSTPSSLTLNVSSGWGMIDRYIIRTFGDYKKSLLDNSTVYVWMRMRPGVIGQISAFSNFLSIDYVDSTPPAQPSGLHIVTKSIDSATISWTASSEADFDVYEIYRSRDNISYSLLSETSSNEFSDTDLEENSIYYYKIKAYDFSGNSSPLSSAILVITEKDLSVPANPSNVRIGNSSNVVHISWNSAPYGNVFAYRVYITPVNEERMPIGDQSIYEVDSSKADISIDGLENGQRYIIILKTVTRWDIESEGVTRLGLPVEIEGPPDVVQVEIVDYASDSGASTNGINISWISHTDPYLSFTGASEILIEEYRSDGTVVTSDWIPTLEGVPYRSIEVFPYKNNSQTFYKSIEPRTLYYVTVRNVDANGFKSLGKRVRHFTRTFQAPEEVQSLSITDRPDRTLVLRWENSQSIFSHNVLSITRTDLGTLTDTVLIDQLNVGRSTIYSLASSYAIANSRYRFDIYCVDEFGNQSQTRTISFDFADFVDLPKPPPPRQQIGFAADKQNVIQWSAAPTESVAGYRIYRALDTVSIEPGDFSLLETVSATTFSYTDYEVENGTTYIYFVTTVDLFGQESLNPIDDSYINYALITLRPASSTTLNPPAALSYSLNGQNVQLTWQPTAGQFDGYEIYRSIGNKFSFQLIATVLPAVTYYVDANALTKTGKVYYIVRKFRNEADLFVTESNIQVSNAILLGKVVTKNGVSEFDLSSVRNISRLEDPVRTETINRLAVHKHEYIDEENDRRINLSDVITVSGWETSDNQTYTTETDISETTVYSVYLNGEEASSYGVLFSLNKIEGSLTFETRLAATGFELTEQTFPFSEPPTVEVRFSNLEEVQNVLPKSRINGVSAQQVGVGIFEKVQIPSVNHGGRIKERLEPVQINTLTVDDGYRYAPVDGEEDLGDGIVFYCIMQAYGDSNVLIAGTSNGIYTSENFGVSWDRRFETITPVLRFFYSEKYQTYFAATNRGILFGRGGQAGDFSIWTEVAGAENAKIIRDICEDEDGNVFCSSDLGVYKLRRDIGQGSFFFQQTPIFGPRSTEAYSLLRDEDRSRIIVSNELGIFETYNSGVAWTFSDEFTEQRPVFAFVASNGYIFAITDYMLWRKSPSSQFFERIGVMESASMSRKMVIWNNRIYITTDAGLMATISDSDIYTDLTVTFEQAFSQLRINDEILPATSLDVIDNKLFVGSEDKLFISDRPGRLSLHWENESEVIPTVYVNGEKQFIGYRFSTSQDRLRKFVCFDVKQKLNSVITVANQYKKYKAKYGGWADTNYLSAVSLFIDGRRMNKMSVSEKPAIAMASLVLPTYNDRNAHKVGADLAKAKFEDSRTKLLAVERNSDGQITALTGFSKDNVVSTLYGIERFLSQIYEGARVVQVTNADGTTSEQPFTVPAFRVILLNPTELVNKAVFGSFGSYKNWARDADNSTSSNIGSFGSELSTDGILPESLIGGSGSLGSNGGGGSIGGGSSVSNDDTTSGTNDGGGG